MVMHPPSSTVATTGFIVDDRLPNRDRLLDEQAMAADFGRVLGRHVHSCARRRTKYRVGESLRVTYDVQLDDETILVSLRCFPNGTATSAKRWRTPDLSLPDLNVGGWIFPNDRKLSALRTFWSHPDARRVAIPVPHNELQLVSYAPEKGAAFRCLDDGSTVGYAKLYSGNAHLPAASIYRALGPMLARQAVAAPRLIGADDKLGVLFISSVPGDLLSTRPEPAHWAMLGGAVAKLHATAPIPGLPRFERATLPRLHSIGALITTARPDIGAGVTRLLDVLTRSGEMVFDGRPDVVLHGDLHGKNVLVDRGRVGFIDLDQAATGPAAAELGSAIAALRYEAMGSGPVSAPLESALLDGYGEFRDAPPGPALSWHIAAALLGERALRAVNRVRLGGLARLPTVIEAALAQTEGLDR